MKRYTDYTDEEIIALSADQIKHLTDIEVAYEGIIPVEKQELEDVPVMNIVADVEVYECRGKFFDNIENAHAFQNMKTISVDYDYSIGSEYKYCQPESDYYDGVKTKHFFKKEQVDEMKGDLKRIQSIKNRNEAKTSEYNKYINSIQKITDSIETKISIASNHLQKIDNAQMVYDNHLKLANNDKEVANNFFYIAYKNDEVLAKLIMGQEEWDKRVSA